MAGKKKTSEADQPKLTKQQRAALAIKKLNKDYGEGTVVNGSEKAQSYEVISTGSLTLDKATGIGGLPKGRIVEIYGMESTGKTTMCLHSIANAHKLDPESECAFIDVEHALDTSYAEDLGIDMKRLYISQPDSAEQALTIMETLILSKAFDVIVMDSVAALIPQGEIDGEMGKPSMASQARLMSGAMRKLKGLAHQCNVLCIFINQQRDSLDKYNPGKTTTGGHALKFYSSIRLEIKKSVSATNVVMEGLNQIGHLVTVKVTKNKTSAPYKKAEFNIIYGKGIDSYGEVLKLAIDADVIKKSGAFYYYKEALIGHGAAKVVEELKKKDEIYQEIVNLIRDTYVPESFVGSDDPDDMEEVSEKVEKEEVEK